MNIDQSIKYGDGQSVPEYPSFPCPEDVRTILQTLQQAGYQAVLAGGCVRDWLMGIAPHDWDIATSARPEEIEKLFPRTLPIGKAFGIIIVILHHTQYEIATFRGDGTYEDGRHPTSVFYASMEEDVRRRDFTVNAMLYDPIAGKLFDFVGGQQDLRNRLIRTVGNPRRRFAEDKLRILRGIRFAANLKFAIHPDTWQALCHEAHAVRQVSVERIACELEKILLGGNSRQGLELLKDSGLLLQILPEVHKIIGVQQPPEFHPEGDVWIHTMLMMQEWDRILPLLQPLDTNPEHRFQDGILHQADAPEKRILAWAILLHDIGKPGTFFITDRIRFNRHDALGEKIARKLLLRLHLPTALIDSVCFLIHHHMSLVSFPQMRMATRRRKLQEPLFPLLLELHRLDCISSHNKLELHNEIQEAWLQEALLPPPPDPILTGKDLIDAGYRPGPQFKHMLQQAQDAFLEHRVTTREEALDFLRNIK